MSRDDFTKRIKEALSKRVAGRCSNPACKVTTSGPHTHPERYTNIGVASHITAAANGGPRYDSALTTEERTSIDNAIWLCQNCAKLVDNDEQRFPTPLLRKWKVDAEAATMISKDRESGAVYYPQPPLPKYTPIPRIAGLPYDEAREKLEQAGWQPLNNHWSYAQNANITYGNGPYFWEKGYHEIISASGTGLGQCAFGFQDVFNNRLVVVTEGEVIEELQATARVTSWRFE